MKALFAVEHITDGDAKVVGTLIKPPLKDLGRGTLKRLGMRLDGVAGDGGALIGRHRGVAHHHVYA